MTLNQHLPHTNTQHWNWTTLPDETFNSFSFAHKQEINFRHIPFWEKTTIYSISEKLIFQSASTHQTRTKLTISCFTQNVHSLAAFLHREWCVSRCVLIGRRNRIKIAIDLVSNLLLPDRVLSHLRHEGKGDGSETDRFTYHSQKVRFRKSHWAEKTHFKEIASWLFTIFVRFCQKLFLKTVFCIAAAIGVADDVADVA